MENNKYLTKKAQETQKIGFDFAKSILKKKKNLSQAIAIALLGDLGAGKTTFLQGFAVGLGIKEKILSPTFVIQRRFSLKNKSFKNFYHIDCYRLESSKDIKELGVVNIIKNHQNIVACEWPQKAKKIFKKTDLLTIHFRFIDENTREIIFDNYENFSSHGKIKK